MARRRTSRSTRTAADARRSAALGVATAALVLVPTLGPLVSGGQNDVGRRTPVTPPGWAFSIWGPIFAVTTAATVQQLRHPTSVAARRTGWPLAGAYAGDAVWSIAAQAGKLPLTWRILPAAAGLAAIAVRRIQGVSGPAAGITATGAGLLLGWTTLASVVNAASVLPRPSADLHSGGAVAAQAAAVTATAGLLATGAAQSAQGGGALAAAAAWGLGTTALTRRPAVIRVLAGAGAIAVLVARLLRRSRPARVLRTS